MVEAYPLYWPADYPRSRSKKRSRFTTTLGAARDFVKDEIRRIGGINPIISTNIPLKDNGDLRADWTRFKVDDTGVAVYFTYKKNPVYLKDGYMTEERFAELSPYEWSEYKYQGHYLKVFYDIEDCEGNIYYDVYPNAGMFRVWGKGDSVITLPVSKIVKFRLSRKKYSDD